MRMGQTDGWMEMVNPSSRGVEEEEGCMGASRFFLFRYLGSVMPGFDDDVCLYVL